MLASFCCPNHHTMVQGVWCDDIHHINILIVFYPIEVFIVIAILLWNIILALPVHDLGWCAADRSNQLCFCTELHGFGNAIAITA